MLETEDDPIQFFSTRIFNHCALGNSVVIIVATSVMERLFNYIFVTVVIYCVVLYLRTPTTPLNYNNLTTPMSVKSYTVSP